ncbi:conserved membrane hypothetical protein [Flavobacterium sp. 9R]|uniref:DUF4345 domain-containing protein n=1 Tax=Flavobacterium sp. 9R TaxID=2653143 RepID=UPI0012F0F771|nr:DUF4345 domain-containing protein [Flavobacterium sp. 9R]VXB36437.1 conserved membrane hypothetical protein [Flavobacterium sp. 9R]
MIAKHLHLILSAGIVFSVAMVYGFQPTLVFDVTISSIDEANIFKAIMGLYLGFAALWIIGVFKAQFWTIATLSNVVFMLGLAAGRIISILFDGLPSGIFVLGIFGELVLGCFAIYNYRKFNVPN